MPVFEGQTLTLFVIGRATQTRAVGGGGVNGQRLLFYRAGHLGHPATSVSVGSNSFGLYQFGAAWAPWVEGTLADGFLGPLVIQQEPQYYGGNNIVRMIVRLYGTQIAETVLDRPDPDLPTTLGGINDSREDGFVGDVGEVLIYNRILTEEERLGVEEYLQVKCNCVPTSSSSSSISSSSSTEYMGSSQSSGSSSSGGESSGSSMSSSSLSSTSSNRMDAEARLKGCIP